MIDQGIYLVKTLAHIIEQPTNRIIGDHQRVSCPNESGWDMSNIDKVVPTHMLAKQISEEPADLSIALRGTNFSAGI